MRKVPKYRLHKHSGQAVVTLSGHDQYLGIFGTEASRRRYDELVAGWLLGQSPAPKADARGPCLAEMLDRYCGAVTHPAKEGRANSRAAVFALACRLLGEYSGRERAGEFSPGALRRWRDWLLAEAPREDGKGYAPSTVNRCLAAAKEVYRWAAENDLVPGAVWHALLAVKPVETRSRRVPPADPVTVEKCLAGSHATLRAALRVQYLAAMRPGEVLGLTPADVSLAGQLPDGTSFAGVWVYVVAPAFNKLHHRGIPRYVFIGPRGQDVLRPFLDGRPGERAAFSPADFSSGGERYSTQSYRHAVRHVCERLELPPWHPNQLRHLKATEIRRDYGALGAEAARVVLGHQLPGVTSVYAEPDYALAARVMAECG